MTAIPLPNGRDLGGTRVAGGTLRHGLLLRSAAPADEASARGMRNLRVSHAVDLRTDAERGQQPVRLADGTVPVRADVLADAAYDGAANLGALAARALAADGTGPSLPGTDLRAVMLESYRDFATLDSARRATADVIRLLADPGADGVLIHCTAGKDRTGWIVAVVLRLLGASAEDILADYLASGPQVLELFAAFTAGLPDPERARAALAPVLGVESDYLAAGHRAAAEAYGSFDGYITDGLRVDDTTVTALRARLVMP